jgi:hypothetical protein
MATFALVGLRDDLGPLIKLSLETHGIPVSAIFNVFEESTHSRFFAIFTPLEEKQGLRVAYFKIFTALEDETFATKTFLRLHIIVLSGEELKEIRRVMKGGVTEAHLPKLAHLTEVTMQTVDDPKTIIKTGMLHLALNRDGALLASFGEMGRDGAMKTTRLPSIYALDALFTALGVGNTYAQEASSDLQRDKHASTLVSCSLDVLYRQGLI